MSEARLLPSKRDCVPFLKKRGTANQNPQLPVLSTGLKQREPQQISRPLGRAVLSSLDELPTEKPLHENLCDKRRIREQRNCNHEQETERKAFPSNVTPRPTLRILGTLPRTRVSEGKNLKEPRR